MSLSRHRVIADIARAISPSLEYEEVLASVAQQAAVAFDISECCLYEHVPENGSALPGAIWSRDPNPEGEAFLGTPLPLADEPAMQRVMTERVMVDTRIDDPLLSAADRRWMEKWNEMSTLYVPLVFGNEAIGWLDDRKLETFLTLRAIVDGRPLGILEVGQAREERVFTEDELELARALGEQAAVTMARRAPGAVAASPPGTDPVIL